MPGRRIANYLLPALLAAVLAASCSVTPTPPPRAVVAGQADYPRDLPGAVVYRVDASASRLHILVYRGGTLARMGHNHVLSAGSLDGYVWLAPAPERSGFDIVVPVADLAVDQDAARAAHGADFPLNVDDAAREGTRNNMLGESQLDAARFPAVSVRSVAVSGKTDATMVTARLQIRDQAREVTVPVALESSPERLRARGEFQIRQTEFGIAPFSVAMGALYVEDVLTVSFDLVALPLH